MEITNFGQETVKDWKRQAEFLRSLDSPKLAARFHRLGINELADLENVDEEKLTKALVAAGKKENLEDETVHEILLQVLQTEGERSGALPPEQTE